MKQIFAYDYPIGAQEIDANSSTRLTAILNALLNSAGSAAMELKIDAGTLMKENRSWVVSRIAFEWSRLPVVGEVLRVETWIDDVERMFSWRNFRLFVGQEQIGVGRSVWTVIDLTTRRPVNLMQEERFARLSTRIKVEMDDPKRIVALPDDAASMEHQCRYSDIDFNGHCNSNKYLEWMLDSCEYDRILSTRFHRVDINYLHEILPTETARVLHEWNDGVLRLAVRNSQNIAAVRAELTY